MKPYIIKTTALLIAWVVMALAGFSQGLIVTSGSKLVLNNDVKLVMNNTGIMINGYITPNDGNLCFTGNSATATSFIGGTNPISIQNLLLNKTANGVQLNQHLSIANSIDFISGDSLFLNGYNIDLGTTGSLLNERGASRITGATGGYIKVTSVLSGIGYNNPGNIGLAISSLSNLGITVIKRYPQQHSGLSITRHFDVTPTVNLALNASVRFYYFDEELAGNLESSLGLFESFNDGTNWTNMGIDGSNYTSNYVQKDGLFALEHLTLSDASVALASNLLSFSGKNENGWNRLHWQTANESEATVYHLERSYNGKDFIEIGLITGRGLLSNSYEYRDRVPGYGDAFYRIRIVEPGSSSYSAVVRIEGLLEERSKTTWSPNPANSSTGICINSVRNETIVLTLSDLDGRIRYTQTVVLKPGTNVVKLNVGNLPNGIYFITPSWLLKQTGPLYIQR